MTRRKDQYEVIDLTEFGKATHTFPQAEEAWKRYKRIKADGGSPEIRRAGNYISVIDTSDPINWRPPTD